MAQHAHQTAVGWVPLSYMFIQTDNSVNNRKHLETHNKKLACEAPGDCPHVFAGKTERYRHYWTFHSTYATENKVPKVISVCDVCHKSFTREEYKRRHLASPTACKRAMARNMNKVS